MKKKVIILMLMLSLPLLFHSCQEDVVYDSPVKDGQIELSAVEKRFMDLGHLKSGDDEEKTNFVEQILNDLDKQDKEKHFIKNFVEKYGYPDWEMTRFFSNEAQTVAQIAVSHDESCFTEAVILCVKDKKKIRYRLFARDKLDKFKGNVKPTPTYEKIEDLFIIFDLQKYGESDLLQGGNIIPGFYEESMEKSVSYYQMIPVCYTRLKAYSAGSSGIVTVYDYICETDYVWISTTGYGGTSSSGYYNVNWYDEHNGGGGSSSAASVCDCNICLVCGGCLEQPIRLKNLPLPGDDDGETTTYCPMCSCPEVIEDPSFSNSKADCVKLKLENGSFLTTLLAGFDLDESEINVTYKVVNLTGVNGKCEYNRNERRIDILIDQDRLNASSMELANTILHETFHAYIFGKLNQEDLHTGLCPEPNFVADLQEYDEKYGNQSQHNYMANKYIEYMQAGLKDYFSNETYRNNYLDYVEGMTEWYGEANLMECLAWSGLKSTDAWSEYYGNQINKTRYDETMQYIVPLLSKENCDD